MSVKLISDSASDMTQREAKELDVIILPLRTVIDGVEYLDGVTITTEEFYQKLESCKTLPTTKQIPPSDFEDTLQPIVEAGDEAVIITLAGKLSGTAQNAAIAAAEVGGRIWLVDSGNVAIGENILLRYAIRLRDQGLAGCEIAEELERVKCRICLLARVDTLEYLVLGGRLPKTAEAAGTLLNTKPVLSVEDGEIHLLGRARNPWQCDVMMNRFIKKKGEIDFSMPVMLAYDVHLKNYIDSSRVLREGHLDEFPITIIGSSVSVHAGPGAIAMAFFSKEKNE